MIFSQRDPRWAGQRLGTVDGVTIGSDGCFVTSYAMVATHFGKDTDPARLDNSFTDGGFYVNGDLCTDDRLTKVYPDIAYQGTYNCQDTACDMNVFNDFNINEHECIIEVDFDHDPNDGIQTHFVRFNSWDGSNLTIDDPWYGDEVSFASRYGDPATVIQKVVKYYGPGGAVPAPTPDQQGDQPMNADQEKTAYSVVLGREQDGPATGRTGYQFIMDAQPELTAQRQGVQANYTAYQNKIDELEKKLTEASQPAPVPAPVQPSPEPQPVPIPVPAPVGSVVPKASILTKIYNLVVYGEWR